MKIAQRRATEAAHKSSTAAMDGPARLAVAALLVVGIGGSRSAAADMTIVQQDATPIVSQPGVGGRILTHVDAGFRLTVLGRDGEWLNVASPQLQFIGSLWVPAGRVGDLVATAADLTLPEATTATANPPQFRIVTDTAGDTAATPLGTAASTASKDSSGVAAAVARSTSADGAASATQATGSSTSSASAATTPSDNAVPAEGNPTPAVGSSAQPLGNPTPAVGSNQTPAIGNSTPAVGNSTPVVGNSSPALGNPTPAQGNPMPAMGNSTPAMGNSVRGFGNSPATPP